MFHRLAVIGSLTGLATGLVTLSPAPALAFPDDTVPPSVRVTLSPLDGDGGWHRTGPTFQVQASDRSGISEAGSEVWLEGAQQGSFPVVDGLAEGRVVEDGHTTLRWSITDTEGNTATGSRSVALDEVAPTASVEGGTRFVDQGAQVPLTASCADATSRLLTCHLDGGVVAGEVPRLDTANARDVTVTAVAIDNAGHVTRTPRTYSVVAPEAYSRTTITTARQPNAAGWFDGPVDATITATDAEPRLPVRTVRHFFLPEGELVETAGATATVRITADGTHRLRGWGVDERGFEGINADHEIRIDSAVPQLWYSGPTSATVGQDLTVSFDCHDALSGIATCSTGGQEGGLRVDTSRPGTQVVVGRAVDAAGNVTTSELLLEVREAQRPEASTTVLAVPARVTSRRGVRATLTLGGYGATGGVVVVRDGARELGRWTVPATVSLNPGWRSSLTVTLPRLAPGTHRLTARYLGNDLAAPSSSPVRVVTSTSPATVTARYGVRAGRHHATVVVRGLDAPATGRVTILDGRRTVGTGVLRQGRVVVRLARLAPGAHRLRARYAGSPRVSAATSRIVVVRTR